MRALFGALLALGLAATAVAAQVDARAEPAVWLKQIYAAYQRAQGSDNKLSADVSTDLVERRASRALAALFKRDADCSRKSNEICALDWDFVIDGQDWEISQVKVGATAVAGAKATVTVSFINMKTPCVNVYYFVRENGDWKVDDIETRPKGEKPTRIAQMLRDFKDY
jgi:Protein of unknown function (DUF3828)